MRSSTVATRPRWPRRAPPTPIRPTPSPRLLPWPSSPRPRRCPCGSSRTRWARRSPAPTASRWGSRPPRCRSCAAGGRSGSSSPRPVMPAATIRWCRSATSRRWSRCATRTSPRASGPCITTTPRPPRPRGACGKASPSIRSRKTAGRRDDPRRRGAGLRGDAGGGGGGRWRAGDGRARRAPPLRARRAALPARSVSGGGRGVRGGLPGDTATGFSHQHGPVLPADGRSAPGAGLLSQVPGRDADLATQGGGRGAHPIARQGARRRGGRRAHAAHPVGALVAVDRPGLVGGGQHRRQHGRRLRRRDREALSGSGRAAGGGRVAAVSSRRGAALRLMVVAALAMVLTGRPAAADEPARVFVITMGPGDHPFFRFGHNAIAIQPAVAPGVVYNWGTFDFESPTLIRDFLRGRLTYWLSTGSIAANVYPYEATDRTVEVQELDLTPAQKTGLARLLEENARPGRNTYRYDYFWDNCSTRVRDAIDAAVGGQLKAATQGPATMSFRHQALRLTAGLLWEYLGLHFGLGRPTDVVGTRWQEAFIPAMLHEELRGVRLHDDGGDRPLVKGERLV